MLPGVADPNIICVLETPPTIKEVRDAIIYNESAKLSFLTIVLICPSTPADKFIEVIATPDNATIDIGFVKSILPKAPVPDIC